MIRYYLASLLLLASSHSLKGAEISTLEKNPHAYDYTLVHSKHPVDHSLVKLENFELVKEDFKDCMLILQKRDPRLKNAPFLFTIFYDKEEGLYYRYFLSSLLPNKALSERIYRLTSCHIITQGNPKKSTHLLFDLLAFIASAQPMQITSIYSSYPFCAGCHAIAQQVLQIDVGDAAPNGCQSKPFPDFAELPESVQAYLTSPLATKIFTAFHQDDQKEQDLVEQASRIATLIQSNEKMQGQLAAKEEELNTHANELRALRTRVAQKEQELHELEDIVLASIASLFELGPKIARTFEELQQVDRACTEEARKYSLSEQDYEWNNWDPSRKRGWISFQKYSQIQEKIKQIEQSLGKFDHFFEKIGGGIMGKVRNRHVAVRLNRLQEEIKPKIEQYRLGLFPIMSKPQPASSCFVFSCSWSYPA